MYVRAARVGCPVNVSWCAASHGTASPAALLRRCSMRCAPGHATPCGVCCCHTSLLADSSVASSSAQWLKEGVVHTAEQLPASSPWLACWRCVCSQHPAADNLMGTPCCTLLHGEGGMRSKGNLQGFCCAVNVYGATDAGLGHCNIHWAIVCVMHGVPTCAWRYHMLRISFVAGTGSQWTEAQHQTPWLLLKRTQRASGVWPRCHWVVHHLCSDAATGSLH